MTLDGSPLARVISLGAGVQSTTLYLMAHGGAFGDRPDLAIFADTQWEPEGVYRHLEWLEGLRLPIPIRRVTKGNLRAAIMEASAAAQFVSIPLHLQNPDGGKALLRRQCTREYKVEPITKEIRRFLGLKPRARIKGWVELWLGISVDEAARMRDNRERWIRNRYPLVERNFSRERCLSWLEDHGFPRPPKSACIGCPYHDNRVWRDMKQMRPREWNDAVDFDEKVRSGVPGLQSLAFLHRSLVPLAEANLGGGDLRQGDLFIEECEGVCGV